MIRLVAKRFSFLHVLVFCFIVFLGTFAIMSFWYGRKEAAMAQQAAMASNTFCDYNIKRISGYKYVKPILWVDENCESDKLLGLKQKITTLIDKYKQYDGVTNASVLIRSTGQWTAINDQEKYQPGSLFKVPVLITILKMDEDNPGFLNKVIPYNKAITVDKKVNFASKTIELGKSYTVKELLTYMIKYSDNAATVLLEQNMDTKTLQKLFSDIGVEVPNVYANQYLFSVKDYSLFMRAIFNAGYLTIKNSEYAAELLTECDFKDGIARGLPPGTKMAHKFGESGTETEKQLHESAVVFLNNKGYLITVMTKGKDFKKLSDLIGDISRTVYDNYNAQ